MRTVASMGSFCRVWTARGREGGRVRADQGRERGWPREEGRGGEAPRGQRAEGRGAGTGTAVGHGTLYTVLCSGTLPSMGRFKP